MKKREIVQSLDDINSRLAELSKNEGGAWIASPMPFSKTVDFIQFRSPSKIPDSFIKSCDPFYDPMVGYKGETGPFSKAAKIREQNRNCGCE